MMLVWTFRPDYDRYTEADSFSGLEGPGYLIRLHANLSAPLNASFLEQAVKGAAFPVTPGEPVPRITGRILPAKNWPDLEKTILPWAAGHLGSETNVLHWLEELARL